MSGVRGVLEFYSVRIGRRGSAAARAVIAMRIPPRAARACVLLPIAAFAGCASVPQPPVPAQPKPPSQPAPYVEPPPPPVNLQGFPPTYRLGFGDGCATGRGTDKKDPVRFANDGNYRVGWQDGLAQCRKP